MIWPKNSWCTSFPLSWTIECSSVIFIPFAPCGVKYHCQSCIWFWLSWLKKYSVDIDDAIGITWCWCWYQWNHMSRESHVASPFYHHDLTKRLVPFMTLLESCDTNTSIDGITWPKKLCSTLFQSSWPNVMWFLPWCLQHLMNKMSFATPCFNHLYLMNKMMPLMMWLVSHDNNASTDGIMTENMCHLICMYVSHPVIVHVV